MKRCTAFACIAVLGLSFASPSGASQPAKSSAGSGQTSTGWTITYNATAGTTGTDLGEFDALAPWGAKFHGDVTCLNVSGNTAVMYGTLSEGGSDFLLTVVDNVNGKGKKVYNPDQISLDIDTDAVDCSTAAQEFDQLLSGNLQVKGG